MGREPKEIKVVEVNPPNEKEADEKIKELSVFLSGTWHTAVNSES